MAISKVLTNSVWRIPRTRDARIRCPVDDIGRNSETPSTMPKINAWNIFIFY
jgi:hypothetical protein